MKNTPRSFAIQDWVDFDAKGRAACPSCEQDGKKRQKNLFVSENGKYWCYRGCTTEHIRAALGAPPPGQSINMSDSLPYRQVRQASVVPDSKRRTLCQNQVQQSVERLLSHQGTPQQQALFWLEARGFTREMIEYYRLGLDQRWLTLNENKPDSRECYWSVSIYIPADEPGQFYKKMRVAPWLLEENRPEYVSSWCQYGVPATIWFTYRPENAEATWYCEGEWDAMRLGWLARQHQSKIAVCCSTGGCGTVPKQDQLDKLSGIVTIFFDRNDEPRKDGTIPGDEGAKKLALTLGKRGKIAQVPMPSSCDVKGWDVSNALDAGYTWSDFESAAEKASSTAEIEQQQAQSQGNKGFQSQVCLTASAYRSETSFSLRDKILEILDRYDTLSVREAALMDLANTTGSPYRDVEKLAKSLATEVDVQFDISEAAKKLSNLLKTRRTQLDLKRYLEPWFAETLIETARAMPTAPEFLFTTLLSAAASRVGTAAKVIIKPSAKYTQPMVFWTAIIANSGSMKTPAQLVILDPLVALETKAYKSFQIESEEYLAERELNKGKKSQPETPKEPSKPPTRKRYLTKDITLETLQRVHGENPKGFLYYRDELAGNTKARNQYRGGHGADEEAELDQWNGSAILYDRAEKSVCLPHSAVSRTGGYQWEVLAKLMGDHNDFNGSFARWLFCAAKTPLRYLRLTKEDKDTGIFDALTFLYTELENVPEQDYILSYEAMELFETWQHQLVNAEQSEDASGLRIVFPKIEAYSARLALWLHVVNAVLRGEKPRQVISGDTMEKAIELAAYYLWQYRLIHTHNSPDSGLAAIALKIQKVVERVGQTTASALKSGVRDLRKMATDQIRQLMQTLANAGYGSVTGEGASMIYVPIISDASPLGSSGKEDTTSIRQLVNSDPEFPATDGVDSIDAECQSECQLSTAQTGIPAAESSQELFSSITQTGTPENESSQDLKIVEQARMSALGREESIDTIDRDLTRLSVPQIDTQQVSSAAIDTIDTSVEIHQTNTPTANLTADGMAKTEVEQFIVEVDGCDASSELKNGTCLSFGSTASWNGFKVGDSVRLSYHQTRGRALVIDPTHYPEMGTQPSPDFVPVCCAYTGKSEWYPKGWMQLAT